MTAVTKPRMPAASSDDLDRALQRETRDGIPDHQRVTCPVHLDWRDRCRSWH